MVPATDVMLKDNLRDIVSKVRCLTKCFYLSVRTKSVCFFWYRRGHELRQAQIRRTASIARLSHFFSIMFVALIKMANLNKIHRALNLLNIRILIEWVVVLSRNKLSHNF